MKEEVIDQTPKRMYILPIETNLQFGAQISDVRSPGYRQKWSC
jgi:hypothetical protein